MQICVTGPSELMYLDLFKRYWLIYKMFEAISTIHVTHVACVYFVIRHTIVSCGVILKFSSG